MAYKLFTDGGARGNPGPAAIGGVLYNEDNLVAKFSEFIGDTTNNKAEYRAILFGLESAAKQGVKELDCFLDSQLVVEQLNRNYKVKDKDLAKLFVKIWNLSQQFTKISFAHIDRAKNKEADALVNLALDK